MILEFSGFEYNRYQEMACGYSAQIIHTVLNNPENYDNPDINHITTGK